MERPSWVYENQCIYKAYMHAVYYKYTSNYCKLIIIISTFIQDTLKYRVKSADGLDFEGYILMVNLIGDTTDSRVTSTRQ